MLSLKRKDLKINSAFLGIAFFLATNFHHQEAVMTGIVILLMIAYPASIHAWIFHQGDTLGEKLKLAKKGQYTSVKLDALRACEFFHMMIWSFLFAGSQKYLALEGFFGLAAYNAVVSVIIIFLMLISGRGIFQVYNSKLKPYMYAVK